MAGNATERLQIRYRNTRTMKRGPSEQNQGVVRIAVRSPLPTQAPSKPTRKK